MLKKGIFIVLSLLLFTFIPLLLIEAYYRITTEGKPEKRFQEINQRPVTVTKELGMVMLPNKMTTRANGYDYSVTQKTNNLGFLDRDHTFEKPKDTYRILFLGDSFVEAVQVSIPAKVHSLTERFLNKNVIPKKVECIALGFSGMGTANELLFYDKLGKKFSPDLVVVVFIANDFPNNSPVLHAMVEGWHPMKGPRFFFEVDHVKNQIFKIDPTLDYYKYMMPVVMPPKTVEKPLPTDSLFSWSIFYKESRSILKKHFGHIDQQKKIDNVFTQRIKFLKQQDFYRTKLEDWMYPDDLDFNSMFFAEKMPKVFNEALRLTDISFKVLKESVEKDGGKVLILADAFMSLGTHSGEKFGRTCSPQGSFDKLDAIARENNIPIINLYDEFLKRGTLEETRWKYDGHWNKKGHRWSAEAVHDFVLKNNYIK